MNRADPAAAVRRAAALVQPGGLVCFHEGDMTYDWAAPMTPLWTQIRAWFMVTLERGTVAPRMGLSLCPLQTQLWRRQTALAHAQAPSPPQPDLHCRRY